MTIKQHGGIFGRNPTFNDVTVDTSLSVDTISEKTSGAGVTIDGFQALNGGAVASANAPKIEIKSLNANGYNYYLQATNTGYFNIVQGDGVSLTGSGAIMRYNPSGYFDVYQNLAMANGKGIDFSATSGTGTSELFDDYEEGTWTPVPADAASGGNTGTAASVEGIYTKVGNTVFVQFGLLNIDTTGLTAGNDFYIQGLPYAAGNTALTSYATGACIPSGNISYTGELVVAITDNTSAIRLAETVSGGNVDYVIVSELTSGGSDIWASLVYRTA